MTDPGAPPRTKSGPGQASAARIGAGAVADLRAALADPRASAGEILKLARKVGPSPDLAVETNDLASRATADIAQMRALDGWRHARAANLLAPRAPDAVTALRASRALLMVTIEKILFAGDETTASLERAFEAASAESLARAGAPPSAPAVAKAGAGALAGLREAIAAEDVERATRAARALPAQARDPAGRLLRGALGKALRDEGARAAMKWAPAVFEFAPEQDAADAMRRVRAFWIKELRERIDADDPQAPKLARELLAIFPDDEPARRLDRRARDLALERWYAQRAAVAAPQAADERVAQEMTDSAHALARSGDSDAALRACFEALTRSPGQPDALRLALDLVQARPDSDDTEAPA